MKQRLVFLFITFFILNSCGDNTLPKPRAQLRLEYPEARYLNFENDLPFTFKKNSLATDVIKIRKQNENEFYGLDVSYPNLKATIYLTYKRISTRDDLVKYLTDAQKFTQEHARKADEISEQVFEDSNRNVYGMFYEVGGDAASQSQFYVTDSTKNFLLGSLYFFAKPNYDSILPAADYLKNDIRHLMETLKWKE